MTHPNAIDLEALACGEAAPRVVLHVDACESCRNYVDRARRASRAEAPGAKVVSIVAAARSADRMRRVAVTAGVSVLAAAAMVLLWAGAAQVGAPKPAPPMFTQMATSETAPGTTFKGRWQVAVIRERGETQERFTDAVRVRPGDRLRIEVALDRPRDILGGVLDEDGGYLELMPDAVRGAGTHLSEKSARIDRRPTHGTILVGTPEAVRRAREPRNFEDRLAAEIADLAVLRVVWEESP